MTLKLIHNELNAYFRLVVNNISHDDDGQGFGRLHTEVGPKCGLGLRKGHIVWRKG